jgi:hypothetical protein
VKTVIVVATVISMTITAYTSHDVGMRGDGITTFGLPAEDGFCALVLYGPVPGRAVQDKCKAKYRACGYGHEFGTLFAVPALGRFFI